ncbi:hypothetical protein HA402_003575 [Bradysia odoriphaga]|nr:hypothetical protein HA402_003575 [Bradysia odoriphaga]
MNDEAGPSASATEPNIIEPRGIPDRRINQPLSKAIGALKQLQSETRAIEVEFFQHVYQLEIDFQKEHDLVYQKRCDIINGNCPPTEVTDVQLDAEKQQSNLPKDVAEDRQCGVPHFWLNVLRSSLPDVHENDMPILQHLTDVRVRNKPMSDLGFILEFHFAPNEFFENAVLWKDYYYTSSDNKMIHEIPLIRKSIGCEIKWKPGKAPTHSSWFDFLSSSKIISDSDEDFMAYITGIQKDFEMGYFIKEHVIPKAVLYFTGEEKNSFTICNYNAGYWTPASPSSESLSEPEDLIDNSAGNQDKIANEDE